MSLLISLGLIHQLMNVYCLSDSSCPAGLACSLDQHSLDQRDLREGKDGGPALRSGIPRALCPDPRGVNLPQGR